MDTSTVLVYLDACRHDYISEENTPFLNRLSRQGFFGKIRTVSGYTQEAAFMTGKYPVETGYFTWYRRSSGKSPFRWTRPISFLRFLRDFRFYYPIKVGIRTLTGLITGLRYQDPAFIPLDILPYFENISATLPERLPNIVSLCNASGHSCFEQTEVYEFIGSRRCGRLFEAALAASIDGQPYDLYVIHVGELDGLGHRYGPHPSIFRGQLREIDGWIQRLYESLVKQGRNTNLVVTSDHGMFNVKGTVDLERRLKQLHLRVPQDYLYFLDSTMGRFWFSTDKVRCSIEEILSDVPNGHIISEEQKKQLHINFENNSYGELFFWVDKGYLIFPNFFQSIATETTRGMHGYMNDEEGLLIVFSEQKKLKSLTSQNIVPLVDVFEIIRELVGM